MLDMAIRKQPVWHPIMRKYFYTKKHRDDYRARLENTGEYFITAEYYPQAYKKYKLEYFMRPEAKIEHKYDLTEFEK